MAHRDLLHPNECLQSAVCIDVIKVSIDVNIYPNIYCLSTIYYSTHQQQLCQGLDSSQGDDGAAVPGVKAAPVVIIDSRYLQHYIPGLAPGEQAHGLHDVDVHHLAPKVEDVALRNLHRGVAANI